MKLPGAAQRRDVWIADDSPLELAMARGALAETYTVREFNEGGTLLEALASHAAPDVVILDWQMPGPSGLEVCQYVRSRPEMSSIAVLLLTSLQKTEDIVRGLDAGADDYLTKPYAAAELAARVGALVRTRALIDRAVLAENTLRSVLENLPDAVLAGDDEGVVNFANAACEGAFRTPRADLLGRRLGELLPTVRLGDPTTTSVAPGSEALAGGGLLLAQPDVEIGSIVFAPAVRSTVAADGHRSYIVTLRDVTEKRRLENRRLDFYSIIAHDLRQPLGALSLRASLLLRGKRGELPVAAQDDLRKMEHRVAEMVELINDFLDLAQIEGVGVKIESKPLALGELVYSAVEDVAPVAEQASVNLSCLVPTEPLRVHADRRRLGQVLVNLLSNALKFTPAGGSVRVELAEDGPTALCSVIDTGRGVPPDATPTLFQRYQRPPQQANDQKGTGLGLMIVREIVEGHGGTVGVDSTPGLGSRFWFRLPRLN